MSYEDFNPIVSLSTVIKGNKVIEVNNPSWENEDVELDTNFNTSFFESFANDLPTYKDGTAASGDQLPWGVSAVWQGLDFTDNNLDLPGGKFDGLGYITDDTFTVGKGVSKYLLNGTGSTAQLNKFAIVIDSGVAQLSDFNINTVASNTNDFNNNGLSYSFVDSDFDGQFKDENPFLDDNGHGTHVAGTIAAKADGKGVVGVAPGAEVISLKVFGASGSTTIDTIMNAVEQAVGYIKNDTYTNSEGVTFNTSALNVNNTVINMSLGGGYYQPLINKIDVASLNGVKFAIAAGNSNKDVDSVSPAASGQSANVYTISAVDKKYKMASFTNWDNDANGSANDDVDFAGPGVNVLSYINSAGQLDWWSGTSMATPAVAGLMLMTDYSDSSTEIAESIAGGKDGIQAGELAFGNDSMPGPYVDPFALTDLKTYTDTNPDPTDPDEGDNNNNNDSSPWDGYDPSKLYYETAGLAAGVNGTYNLSTGSGSVEQTSLETVLSIDSGKLDQSMQSVDGTLTKEAIDATEGSGVKLTGYAKEGDSVSFSYVISSNDYIPYNDFTFVQLKTGDALGAQSQSTIKTLGAIGLDVDNFGSKVGNYSYTFTKEDFFSNDKTLGGATDADAETGEPIYQGYFDLSVGVTDVIDTWVSTSLLVQSLQLTGKGEEPTQATDTYTDNVLTWITGDILGKGVATGAGDSIKWNMSTGSGSVGQGVVESLIGLSQGELDSDLGGTKTAINATTGQFTYATTKAKVGEVVEFEAIFDTNDYSPYKDFSYYTINGEAFKIAAVGEDVSDFGKIKKIVQYTVQESDFDKDGDGVSDANFSYDETAGGGNLKIGFGVSNAIDWCVESSLEISKVKVYEPGSADAPPAENKTKADVATGFDSFDAFALGNVVGDAPTSISNGVINNDAELTYLQMSTNYSYGQIGGGLATQSQIEFGTGLKNKTLDTSLNGTKTSKNATSGSAVYIEGVGAVGDQIMFDFDFISQDYSPYQDFAFASVNGEAYTLVDNGIGQDTLAPTGAKAMVDGSKGSSDISGGTFTYTLTQDDLGGKFGDITISVGVMNALDNAVETSLKMYNMQYIASGVTDEVGDFTTGFADDYVATYETIGDVWVEKDAYSGFSLSTGGCVSNAVSQSQIESLMGTSGSELDKDLQVYGSSPGTLKTAINATEGSAVKFNNVGSAGDTVSFFYNFTTNDYLPYADFSFFTTASGTQMIAGVGNSSVNNGNVDNYGSKEGLVTYVLQENDIKTDGTFDISVGIVDAKDTWVESVIDIWGFNVTGSNETAPVYDENDSANNGDKPTKEEAEYDNIDIEMVGNTFQQNDAMVMSTGSGSVQQIQLESALGIKTGDLDTTLNNTKAAGNATEGSAAYDTVTLNVGDVVSFGYTFGTDDYIPYQDFAFFSINGKVENIATVGVDVPNYGEISKVFNYVVTSADLGGQTSGNATIGVGIVDAEDSWVDSFIEVYDFQISGEALENDKSNDGIVDGAGAFAIQTASASQVGSYSASNSSKVKLSIDGLGTVSDSTSDQWTIAASTYSADGFGSLSAIEGGGYYTLFKALGTSEYAGKWAFATTDLDGNITLNSDYANGKAGIIDATWFDTDTIVNAGWEEFFGYDINNDSLISQLEGSTDALSLYSAQTGIIKIQDSNVDVSTSNILAATPTKADFSTFSKSAETYKILVAGTEANANKFQVWTSTNSGTIISKAGFVDYTGQAPITNEWFTVDQAVSEGLEDLFTQDLNTDGLISGGPNYQIFDAPNSKLQLKNIKGTTLSTSNTPEYNVIGAKKILTDNTFDVLFKGSSTSAFAGQYAIWKTNQYGKVTSEGNWFQEDYLINQFVEEQFLVDANNDGFIGSKVTLTSDTSSGFSLSQGAGGQAIATDNASKTSSYITYEGASFGTSSGNYQMLDAESINGTNYVLWNNTAEQKAAIWTMDTNWAFVSGDYADYGSANFYKLESWFGQDLDNNGITATVDATTEVLDVNASTVQVENTGDITASYGVDNVIYVAASTTPDANFSLKFQNGQEMKNIDVGGTLIATEKVSVFGEAASSFSATDVAAAYLNDSGINLYVCDLEGNYVTEGFAANKSDNYFALETGYNQDFDGDGIIGIGTTTLDNVGSVTVKYNQVSDATIVENGSEFALKYDGAAMKSKLGNWTLQFAEAGGGTSKVAVYTDSITGEVAQWNCDEEWNYVDGTTFSAGDSGIFALETSFGTDINSDSIIGLDANGDNLFTDADLSAQYIENKGSISLLTDIGSQIYAGSASNLISFNGKASKNDELSGLGWEIIGVDTGLDSTQTQNNYMVIKETLTGTMALCNFGSDWDFGSNDTFEVFNNSSDAIFAFAENTMVQDFNNNTLIGS